MDRWIDDGQRERQRNLKLRVLSTFVTAALFRGFQETHRSWVEANPGAQKVTCQLVGLRWGGPRVPGKVTQAGSGGEAQSGDPQALRWHPRAGSVFRGVLPPLEPRNVCNPDTVTPLQGEGSLGPQMLPHPLSAPMDIVLAHPSCLHMEPQNHLKKADPRISWDPRTQLGIKRGCLFGIWKN